LSVFDHLALIACSRQATVNSTHDFASGAGPKGNATRAATFKRIKVMERYARPRLGRNVPSAMDFAAVNSRFVSSPVSRRNRSAACSGVAGALRSTGGGVTSKPTDARQRVYGSVTSATNFSIEKSYGSSLAHRIAREMWLAMTRPNSKPSRTVRRELGTDQTNPNSIRLTAKHRASHLMWGDSLNESIRKRVRFLERNPNSESLPEDRSSTSMLSWSDSLFGAFFAVNIGCNSQSRSHDEPPCLRANAGKSMTQMGGQA